MGCFTACFGNSKDGKKKTKQKVLSHDQRYGCLQLEPVEQSLIPGNLEKHEDELSSSNKKRVTFDTNVKTHEPISIYESTNSLDLIEIAIKADEPNNNLLNPTTSQPLLLPKDGICPPNHRYMNCTEDSDEEEEEEQQQQKEEDEIGSDQETDLNDCSDNDRESTLEQVWSEAIPVASMEARTDEVEDSSMKLSHSPVYTVLNPLGNIFEWKAAKSQETITQLKLPQKENHHHNYHDLNPKDAAESMEEIDSVDASLSNWLVATPPSYKERLEMNSSEKKEEGSSKSPVWRRLEDRPILGALTMEELNKYSGDAMPINGTVNRYLTNSASSTDKKKTISGSVSSFKGIPNTTSKYREDKKVNWHSTPFEKRLDKALQT